MPLPDAPAPSAILEAALYVDNLDAAGVEIEADFRWPNGARSVYFRDPSGNSLELAEPHLWS